MTSPARDIAGKPLERPPAHSDEYWDGIAGQWSSDNDGRAWRLVSDAVNTRLLASWLQPNPSGIALKTDLFDEVYGEGLVPWLAEHFGGVAAIDVAGVLVEKASERFPQLAAQRADVRALPFPDGAFDTVISNSTLDHFSTRDDIALSLRELNRVLRHHGHLLITLDNPLNPVVALRNALPPSVRSATRLVPFTVGATCGPRRLRGLLEGAGFEIVRTGAIFHAPRALVALAGRAVDRRAALAARGRWVRFWTAFEALGALPTRLFTGYFVAALARKR